MNPKSSRLIGLLLFLPFSAILLWQWCRPAPPPAAPVPSITPHAAAIPNLKKANHVPQARVIASERSSMDPQRKWRDFVASITAEDLAAHVEAAQRSVTLSRMPGIVARYHVDPARTKELELLLLDREHLRGDLDATQTRHKNEGLSATIEAFGLAEAKRIETEIAGIIGTENMGDFSEEINRAKAPVYLVEFLGEAYARGIAISPEREKTLNVLLTEETAIGDWQMRQNDPPNQDTGLNDYDRQVLSALSAELNQQQLDLLKKIRSESRAYASAGGTEPDHWIKFTLGL